MRRPIAPALAPDLATCSDGIRTAQESLGNGLEESWDQHSATRSAPSFRYQACRHPPCRGRDRSASGRPCRSADASALQPHSRNRCRQDHGGDAANHPSEQPPAAIARPATRKAPTRRGRACRISSPRNSRNIGNGSTRPSDRASSWPQKATGIPPPQCCRRARPRSSIRRPVKGFVYWAISRRAHPRFPAIPPEIPSSAQSTKEFLDANPIERARGHFDATFFQFA